jgi:hypothetical protein
MPHMLFDSFYGMTVELKEGQMQKLSLLRSKSNTIVWN